MNVTKCDRPMKNVLKETSIQFVKGVGPARKRLFQNLGIETIEDLLYFFPRRYEDRTRIVLIAMAVPGETQTVMGHVQTRGGRQSWWTRKHVYETEIDDGTGKMRAVWFNQPYLDRYFVSGRRVVLYGRVEVYKDRLQMVSPEYEVLSDTDEENLNTGRIVPIYPLTRGMTQRYLRRIVKACLDRFVHELTDVLPVSLRNKHRLANIRRGIVNIHFPLNSESQEEAARRISFEEFFLFQLSVLQRRRTITAKDGTSHHITDELIRSFSSAFPFRLTRAQSRVIREIAEDMRRSAPMLRLLQGDVGSGKTLVALFGCVCAWRNGKQSALMAPTEILARQHYQKIMETLVGFQAAGGGEAGPAELKVVLLTGTLPKTEANDVREMIRTGQAHLVIGTHALLSKHVDFRDLSYVVIDEQHKFGVSQRALLTAKGRNPDVLVMTATPIPRTLTLSLFGDLDVSTLDELPKGRGKIKTVLYSMEQSAEAYTRLKDLLREGRQAYVVYPVIEESETFDLKAARAMHKHFAEEEFKEFKVGLLHGRMKKDEAGAVMDRFKSGGIDLLVSTTVLEVGVDVANASVMVVEHAERFGLAQLHQLRGRVGRGAKDSVCLLIADHSKDDAAGRLEVLVKSNDGFKIAERDLELRGPGKYFGRHQHGLNELKFANPLTQIDLLQLARDEAGTALQEDPELRGEKNRLLREVIRERYPGYLQDIMAG